ncbi:tetratricopeptide repeat protein [Methanothermococcus sp.]|uniref:tetratricopeptide repeat protein n=1 Tax=Methanothermococcus sp. TaxID=2614238 RepID=UPI0025D7F4D8|nr:tetratricopeptide repeat protein [Methanothermococcus sp.]
MCNETPEYFVKKGIAAGNNGNHEAALKYFNRAIEIKPTYIDAWFYKTLALRNLGRYDEALECFKKALILDRLKNNK